MSFHIWYFYGLNRHESHIQTVSFGTALSIPQLREIQRNSFSAAVQFVCNFGSLWLKCNWLAILTDDSFFFTSYYHEFISFLPFLGKQNEFSNSSIVCIWCTYTSTEFSLCIYSSICTKHSCLYLYQLTLVTSLHFVRDSIPWVIF